MEGPRAPRPEEFQDILTFLNTSLRESHSWSIAKEYPTAINAQSLHNIRIIKSGNELLSHAVIKPLILKTPEMVLKVAAIGSVVTNSSYRNQGLSTQIIEACIEEAKRQDCDIAVLWTNLFEFYRRFGFELAGYELSATVSAPLKFIGPKLQIREGSKVDPTLILKLYQRHTVHSFRTPDEVRAYLNIPNSRVYTAWDEAGQLVAYAIEGKGADLDGYIHEWGGGTQELLQLISHIQQKQNRDIVVIMPAHSVNLVEQMRRQGCFIHEGNLGMIKILDPPKFINKAIRHLKQGQGLADIEQTLNKFNESQLTSVLFGPTRLSDLIPLDGNSVEKMNQVIPIRLWFWGWDSV